MKKIFLLLLAGGFLSCNQNHQSGRNILRNDMIIRHSFYGGRIDFSSFELIDKDGKTTHMNEIAKERPKLVLRISDTNCRTCIVSIISILMSFSTEIDSSDIILFITQSNSKYTKLLYHDLRLTFPAYIVPHNLVNNKIETLNEPYLFVLYPDSTGRNTFIPEKIFPEITNNYLFRISTIFE